MRTGFLPRRTNVTKYDPGGVPFGTKATTCDAVALITATGDSPIVTAGVYCPSVSKRPLMNSASRLAL